MHLRPWPMRFAFFIACLQFMDPRRDEATFESPSLFSRRVRDRDFQHSFPLPSLGTVQMQGQKNA